MHYSIKTFDWSHLDQLDQRDEQKDEIAYILEHKWVRQAWEKANPLMTLCYDDKPIFVLGIQNGGFGSYYPIVFSSKGLDKHVRHVIRFIYKYVDDFVGTDVHRFEAYVSSLDPPAGRIARFFGFEPVGIRRQAGMHGEDQIIYERLWRK